MCSRKYQKIPNNRQNHNKKITDGLSQINANKILVDHPIHKAIGRCSLIYKYLLRYAYTEQMTNGERM